MQDKDLKKLQFQLSVKRLNVCPHNNCTAAFDRPYKLKQHLLVHEDVRPFQCNSDNCQKAYTSKSHLLRHIQQTHGKTEENSMFECPTCLNKFANKQNLKRHINLVHSKDKPIFSCDQCNVHFKKKHQLSTHMYQHTGILPFSCDLCSKRFYTQHEKRRHTANHKEYTCEPCFKVFKNWSSYSKHRREEHCEQEYICNNCNKKFKRRDDIVRHIKAHDPNHMTRVFQCPYEDCYRYYTRKSNLVTHIKIKHQNVRHNCKICGASICTKAKLNYHMRLHDQIKPKVICYPTKAEGRRDRKDKGMQRLSTAARIAGLARPPSPPAPSAALGII